MVHQVPEKLYLPELLHIIPTVHLSGLYFTCYDEPLSYN